jgi:hypothetical protein
MVKPLIFFGTPAWHPSTGVNKDMLEHVHKRAFRFVYGRHIPEQSKTRLLNVDQQLRYNDLTLFRKCLDGDTDAMARITTGRVMRETRTASTDSFPQKRALTSVSTRSLSGSPPSGIPSPPSSNLVPRLFPKIVPRLCDVRVIICDC